MAHIRGIAEGGDTRTARTIPGTIPTEQVAQARRAVRPRSLYWLRAFRRPSLRTVVAACHHPLRDRHRSSPKKTKPRLTNRGLACSQSPRQGTSVGKATDLATACQTPCGELPIPVSATAPARFARPGLRCGPPARGAERGTAEARPPAIAPSGLVTCAIKGRDQDPGPSLAEQFTAAGLWNPAFPSADMVPFAADLFDRLPRWPGPSEKGPRWRITVSPGAVQVGSHDPELAERTYERQLAAQ